ncbi:MAG TPA: DUF3131 domain-containing protein [Ramlibacter sp.]|uniref:DUF3131 domain-containing protein n=1 Tax=Ramlibacter sp. TaxID=1917967 RepID=UPI002D2F22C5|nr:DUF3131 domain-containing protein [Ramlibacter sp.]HZY20262.1 DUF3131 domain-containing protein [Ramlibacter sp.]
MRRRAWGALPLAAMLAGCGAVGRPGGAASFAKGPPAGLSAQEFQWARTAWRYLENNTDYDSGLVPGMDRQPTFTAWNAGDALAATIAAHELQVIDAQEFDLRLSRLLGFLGTMDLSDGQLPNKAYRVDGGKMVGFDNREADIGWSAVDIGRLLLWLRIAGQRHPRFAEYADKAVLRWRFCDVVDACGVLHGSLRSDGRLVRYQEGRLGYEQLAAAGYAAWGFDVRAASRLPPTVATTILGRHVLVDARDPRTSGAQAPVLTMPYVLAGLEFGWQAPDGSTALREPAQQVFRVQEERWRREHQFTARSDYQLPVAPYVVLDAVHAAGYAWNTIDGEGREHDKLAMVSTRAAFGMAALWPGEYGDRLLQSLQQLHDPDRGWFEGRYETGAPNTTITLSTNTAVLEALLYKLRGPLYARDPSPGLFQRVTADPFARLGRCWPGEREGCAAPQR